MRPRGRQQRREWNTPGPPGSPQKPQPGKEAAQGAATHSSPTRPTTQFSVRPRQGSRGGHRGASRGGRRPGHHRRRRPPGLRRRWRGRSRRLAGGGPPPQKKKIKKQGGPELCERYARAAAHPSWLPRPHDRDEGNGITPARQPTQIGHLSPGSAAGCACAAARLVSRGGAVNWVSGGPPSQDLASKSASKCGSVRSPTLPHAPSRGCLRRSPASWPSRRVHRRTSCEGLAPAHPTARERS